MRTRIGKSNDLTVFSRMFVLNFYLELNVLVPTSDERDEAVRSLMLVVDTGFNRERFRAARAEENGINHHRKKWLY